MEALLAGQRLLVLVLGGWFVSRVVVVRRPPEAAAGPPPLQAFATVCGLLFLATFAWQAWWTLAADQTLPFQRVERYDTRAWQLASAADRREITDRLGAPLAANRLIAGRWQRVYPLGPAAAHVTGYLDRRYGRTGLEAACDATLATWRQPAWERLREVWEQGRQPQPWPLRLTLDARLQRVAAKALAGRRGAVVVLSPAAGDVLALVSLPAFEPAGLDPARFDRLAADRTHPLLHRALHGRYPPGSTFKPLVAAAALAAGLPATTRHRCGPGGYLPPYDTQRIQDWEAGQRSAARPWRGHGELTMPEALARSANTWFAWLGVQLGAPPILATARAAGWEEAWDLTPGARPVLVSFPGALPRGHLKPGDTARLAIGQHEVLTTPLGLAVVTSTLANYGRLVAPRLLLDQLPAVPRQVLDAGVAAQVQELMAGVVAGRSGTGRGLRSVGVPVAAKTGSAENPHGAAHAWVVAFAPVERASVALAVVVENGGTGSETAVPIAREVLLAARAAGYLGAQP